MLGLVFAPRGPCDLSRVWLSLKLTPSGLQFLLFYQNALGKRTPPTTIDKTWEVFEEAFKPKVQPVAEAVSNDDSGAADSESADTKADVDDNKADPSDFSVSNGDASAKKKKKKEKKNKERSEDQMEVEAKKKEEVVPAEAAGDEEEAENQVRLLEP